MQFSVSEICTSLLYQARAICSNIAVGYRDKKKKTLNHDKRFEGEPWKSGAIVDFGLDTTTLNATK